MSGLPESKKLSCTDCGVDVAYVTSPTRKSRGVPRETLIDFWPDTGQGGTVPVELKQGTLYGDAVPRHMADAMRAAGRQLHAQHHGTCAKRNASKKRS